MRVAVIGASGVLGRNLVARLIEAGYEVRACVRSPGAAPPWPGVEEGRADILDAASLQCALPGRAAVVNVGSSIPRPDRAGGDWSLYDRIRREGVSNLMGACSAAGATLVQQSIAMLHRAR